MVYGHEIVDETPFEEERLLLGSDSHGTKKISPGFLLGDICLWILKLKKITRREGKIIWGWAYFTNENIHY